MGHGWRSLRRGGLSLLAVLLLGACQRAGEPQPPERRDYGNLGGDFALTDQRGRPFRLEQLRGKVVLLFFGYTFCPDFCPMTLAKLAGVGERLGSDKERVRVVFVSVDPERDVPEKLREYLDYFAVDAIGLTGTSLEIERVARQYGVSYERRTADSAAGYLIDHSAVLFLIDPEGKVGQLFRQGDSPEAIAAAVKGLLAP
jgi:cytochrome oxidase Cu insertion factor (SCO1/SenC/PrrC family)